MKSLCIKTNNSNLLEYLFQELKTINIPDICFCQNQFKHYKNIIIHYTGKDLSFFYSKMSSLLSLLILTKTNSTNIVRPNLYSHLPVSVFLPLLSEFADSCSASPQEARHTPHATHLPI